MAVRDQDDRDRAAHDRWEGQVDSRLERASDRLDTINGDINEIKKVIAQMSIDLAVLKTRVAVYSAAGSITGAAFVSFLFQHFAR